MSMKAIVVEQPGDSSQLKYKDVPVPEITEDEVLVKNSVCGVNFIDVYMRKGVYALKPGSVLGIEGAGVIEIVGEGVTGVAVGDRVAYAHIGSGGYAEFSKLPAQRVVPLTDELPYEQVATAMIQGMTAHYLVTSAYKVQSEDKVLVQAAAGGTGSLICQVAKLAGAYVIGTSSTEEKAAKARAAGADEVILYTQKDFVQEVKRITEGKGVKAVYDGVGKTTFLKGFQCLASRGTMVNFGASSGAPDPVDIGVIAKGSFFLTRPSLFAYIAADDELRKRSTDVLTWIRDGKLKFDNFNVFPLADAKKAHDFLESRGSTGKILLKP